MVIKNCQESKDILSLPTDMFTKLQSQSEKVSSKKLLAFMEKLSGIEADLKYALNPRVLLEITCLECASLDENGSKKN
jgi:DNA polymerase III gamma/tau subunit